MRKSAMITEGDTTKRILISPYIHFGFANQGKSTIDINKPSLMKLQMLFPTFVSATVCNLLQV